jgi:hypothetical protein
MRPRLIALLILLAVALLIWKGENGGIGGFAAWYLSASLFVLLTWIVGALLLFVAVAEYWQSKRQSQ